MNIRIRLFFLSWLLPVALVLAANAQTRSEIPTNVIVKPGFRLEEVYQVPGSQGSWVSIAFDQRGRFIASDEEGGIYLASPSAIGQSSNETRVKPILPGLGEAQGLACLDDDLYLVVNTPSNRYVSGLYRARDTDGDTVWDSAELLKQFQGSGEHGPHAVIASVDGDSLYVCCGNHTSPLDFGIVRPPGIGPDDTALSRLVEPTPHHGIYRKQPAGWIARTDRDGKSWELVSIGYRNQYDLAIDRSGELFTYDSDMEYDIGTPWYRPTRVCHATSGSDYGWRSGVAKLQSQNPDTLPPVAELGPGSPTGLQFGYDTNFPSPFRNALFAADWGRGIIHALVLKPRGASFGAEVETLLRATPLPVTDMAVHPTDGALYFTTGGRGIKSAVYRLVYAGTPKLANANEEDRPDEGRALRHRLEALHKPNERALEVAWPALDDEDRFIRYAARVALEHQDVSSWRAKALGEPRAGRRIAACLALVRRDPRAPVSEIIAALTALSWDGLSRSDRCDWLRVIEVAIARHGNLKSSDAEAVGKWLKPRFPSNDGPTDRMMTTVLSRLDDADALSLIVESLEESTDDDDILHAAHALCVVEYGWTPDLRETYFRMLEKLCSRYRDSTFSTYIEQIAERAVLAALTSDRPRLQQRIEAAKQKDLERPASTTIVRKWSIDDAVAAFERSANEGDAKRGERYFKAARCIVCHRFQSRGGAVGPDLTTVGARYSVRELTTAIIEPDSTVADQYKQTMFVVDGRTIIGTVIDQREKKIRIATDMTDPKRHSASYSIEEIESQTPSTVSPMPQGLVDVLDEAALLDLIAFLRSQSGA